MKRLFALSFLIFSTFAIYGEVSFSPSVFSRIGYLLYSKDSSSRYFYGGVDCDVESDFGKFNVEGVFLNGKSDRKQFNGNLDFGSVFVGFENNRFSANSRISSFNFPDELKILDGKPSFKIFDSKGFLWNFGGRYAINSDFCLKANFLLANANSNSGDLYFFYGKPDELFLFGGKISIEIPLDFEIHSIFGKMDFELQTNESINIGDLDSNLISLFLSKKFCFNIGSESHTKIYLGYMHLDLLGNCFVSNNTQTYALFPYKYAEGNISETLHFLSMGNSFYYRKRNFNIGFDFFYFLCTKNDFNGEYKYQYKKSLFFDGSSGGKKLSLPNVEFCHIFAGDFNISYKFEIAKHFQPTLEFNKVIAGGILNNDTKKFLNSTFSSKSTISSDSNSNSIFNDIMKILLAGSSIYLKVKF